MPSFMAYLPLFPLKMVAFPGEKVSLHIFEARYRELIAECIAQAGTFGLPTFLNGVLPGYGTEMEITEVAHAYEDGRFDIRTRGVRVFRILEFENPAPGKLYAGGTVEFMEVPEVAPAVRPDLIEAITELYHLLKITLPHFHLESAQPFSYQVAHGVGLPPDGEYELLTLATELERQEYIVEHLRRVIPVIENVERTKEVIRMNGDFRKFGEELDL
jgi:Lon protease-like protein